MLVIAAPFWSPLAASSPAVIRYTERPNRLRSVGARSLPDVELSWASAVNVHEPSSARSGTEEAPLPPVASGASGALDPMIGATDRMGRLEVWLEPSTR